MELRNEDFDITGAETGWKVKDQTMPAVFRTLSQEAW
jgi:hypothetical protein